MCVKAQAGTGRTHTQGRVAVAVVGIVEGWGRHAAAGGTHRPISKTNRNLIPKNNQREEWIWNGNGTAVGREGQGRKGEGWGWGWKV